MSLRVYVYVYDQSMDSASVLELPLSVTISDNYHTELRRDLNIGILSGHWPSIHDSYPLTLLPSPLPLPLSIQLHIEARMGTATARECVIGRRGNVSVRNDAWHGLRSTIVVGHTAYCPHSLYAV